MSEINETEKSEKKSLYDALDIGQIWLSRKK